MFCEIVSGWRGIIAEKIKCLRCSRERCSGKGSDGSEGTRDSATVESRTGIETCRLSPL